MVSVRALCILLVAFLAGPLHTAAVSTPPGCASLVDVLTATPNVTLFLRALNVTGVLSTLVETNAYTVFAPQDAAFGSLLKGYGVNLITFEMAPRVMAALPYFLNYHIVSGRFTVSNYASQLTNNEQLTTLLQPSYNQDKDICESYDIDGTLVVQIADNIVSIIDDKTTTDASQIVLSNQLSCNSVVHVVNRYLNPCLPATAPPSSPPPAPQNAPKNAASLLGQGAWALALAGAALMAF